METVDGAQRRFTPVAFPLGVIYKFFDDQGNYLAAILTYYAFIAIFPLLLLGSSILGFLLQGNPHLQEEVLNSALRQFPIIGDELGRKQLHGSTSAIVVGGLTATYGAMGLGQAIQNTVNIAWSVPRNSRPNPILLHTNMGAGHKGAAGRYDALKDAALNHAFALWAMERSTSPARRPR